MHHQDLSILLIEDNPGDARLIEIMLSEPKNHRISLTSAGRLGDGLHKMDQNRFDAVLLDLSLPDSHKLETLQRIREQSLVIPVIVLTSLDDEKVSIQALKEGAQDYLIKGQLTGEVLLRSIFYAIERQRTIESLKKNALLEEELRQAHKMEAIGKLTGGIAHDFNNILGAIAGYADLLKMDQTLHEKQHNYARKIASAAQRASDHISKLLTFSRRTTIEKRSLEISGLVQQICDILRPTIGSLIEIKFNPPDHKLFVTGDQTQLINALINLAVNARDAMPDGGSITLSLDTQVLEPVDIPGTFAEAIPGPCARLRITDNGTGIEPDVMQHIFEPFYTTKGPGKGTGLGLASVYGCIKQHGGVLAVHSEVGKGTEFTIQLPLNTKEQPAPLKTPAKELVKGTGTILVVDDEKLVGDAAAEMLRMLGYTVVRCSNGEEAIHAFQARDGRFDLVLLDILMPNVNGLECYRRLKQIDTSVKVIAVSGYSDHQKETLIMKEGAMRFVKKPYRLHELSHLVAECLADKNATTAPTP